MDARLGIRDNKSVSAQVDVPITTLISLSPYSLGLSSSKKRKETNKTASPGRFISVPFSETGHGVHRAALILSSYILREPTHTTLTLRWRRAPRPIDECLTTLLSIIIPKSCPIVFLPAPLKRSPLVTFRCLLHAGLRFPYAAYSYPSIHWAATSFLSTIHTRDCKPKRKSHSTTRLPARTPHISKTKDPDNDRSRPSKPYPSMTFKDYTAAG